ncbi:cytochrome P450 [Suillus weaverae]|nr:cytochrome P450 [Suillus weaverae]
MPLLPKLILCLSSITTHRSKPSSKLLHVMMHSMAWTAALILIAFLAYSRFTRPPFPQAVLDLLDKRGSLYSDKPHLVMAGELYGCENMAAFTPYGDCARRQRRLMQKVFGPAAIFRYHGLMQMKSRPFLSRLVGSPLHFQDHIRRYAGGLTFLVVYGHQVKSNDDPFLNLAEECVDILANRIASRGGIWPVDIFPFPKMEEFVDCPYKFVKSEVKKGTAYPSFVSSNRNSSFSSDNTKVAKDTATDDHDIRRTANSMYSGIINTTITTLSHFILAMVQHPHVLRRAQAELDDVLGSGQASKTKRLPTFEDRPKLPYCDAVFTETLRWGVPVPLSLLHRLTQPDTYEGMYIPQESLVYELSCAILGYIKIRRWLADVIIGGMGEEERDPKVFVFGFRRRRCPGTHLIESSIWLLITSMLATLDICKARDEQIEPVVRFENIVFRTLSPFVCDIHPRSEEALRLIMEGE